MAKEKVAPIKYPEITKAGERYIEQYGDPLVTNTYLKMTVLILALVIAGMAAVMLKEIKALADIRPLIIRIDDVGHAEAVDYKNFAYKPQESENKYYLTRWTQLLFQRNKFTIENDQTQSLYFFDSAHLRPSLKTSGRPSTSAPTSWTTRSPSSRFR